MYYKYIIQAKMETEELILRNFNQEEVKEILDIFSDIRIAKSQGIEPLKTIEEAKKYLENNFLKYYEKKDGYHYAICDKKTDKPVGFVHIKGNNSRDLQFGIKEEFENKGLTTKILEVLLKRLKTFGVPYSTAVCDAKNIPAQKVLKKLGMEYKYSFEDEELPRSKRVRFRMYQLDFYENETYTKYWYKYPNHFIEKI